MKSTFRISAYALTGCLLIGGAFRTLAADRADARSQSVPNTPAVKTEPYNWRNVKIVAGGFVTGIVFSPKQPDLAYARTDMGGAYRWDAREKHWMPLTDWAGANDWNLLGIESLAADPKDANRVYLAVGTYTNSWAGNGAILRSTDQGRTWKRADLPFKLGGNEDGRSIGERLAIDPNQTKLLYFGSRHNGLWQSADYGATWKEVESFPVKGSARTVGIGFVVFDPRSSTSGSATKTLYVSVANDDATLYRSTDSGATWEAVPGQPKGLLPHHGVLDTDGALYVTYSNGPGPNGVSDGAVWKLDTRSGSWTDITPLKPGTAGAGNFGYAGLAVDARRPGTLLVTTLDKWSSGDDLFRSTDGGKMWRALGASAMRDCSVSPFLKWGGVPKLGWWIGSIAIDPFHSDHVLYVTGATIWGTHDATAADRDQTTHWAVEAQGIEQTAVLDLISPPTGAHLLSGLGDIGGFRHDDLTVSPPEGMASNPIFGTTTSLDFAETASAIMARVGNGPPGKSGAISTDGGKTWTPFASAPAGSQGGGEIAVSADGKTLLWMARNAPLSYSQDNGATWKVCQGLPNTNRLNLASDRVNPAKFYVVDASAGTLYVSTDGGVHFTARATGLPIGRPRLRVPPGREGDLWLTTDANGLYRSTDSGATFTKQTGVQEGNALGFGKAAPGQTYPALYLTGKVESVWGVFRSDDAGATWVRINDDQHQYGSINQVVIGDPRVYGRVYLGTNGRGILYADPARLSTARE